MKNSLEGLNSQAKLAKKSINLKQASWDNPVWETQQEKNEEKWRATELGDSIKQTTRRWWESEAKKEKERSIWRNNGPKLSTFSKKHAPTHQEVQQTPNKINSEIHTQAHHSQAVKRQRTLKAAREQQLITYTRSSVTVAANLSPEIMEVRGAVKEREHRVIL